MHEAFQRVWEHWGRAPSLADPPGYLYRTAMNVYRSRRRRGFTALRRVIGLNPGRDELAAVEARNDVVQALRALTPRQRLSVVLIELLDYSSKEAALTAWHVQRRIVRAFVARRHACSSRSGPPGAEYLFVPRDENDADPSRFGIVLNGAAPTG